MTHLFNRYVIGISMAAKRSFGSSLNKCVLDIEKRAIRTSNLPMEQKEEIYSELEDWKVYMDYKEHQEKIRDTIKVLPFPRIRASQLILEKPRKPAETEKRHSQDLEMYNSIENDNMVNCRMDNIKRSCLSEIQPKHKGIDVQESIATEERLLGNKCFKEKKYYEAYTHYTNSISIRPNKDAYNNRGFVSLKMKNYSNAITDLNKAVHLDPTNVKALYRRALCFKETNQLDEALKDLDTALLYEPKNGLAKSLSNEVKNIISKRSRKLYRIREIHTLKELEVTKDNLFAHCISDKEYVLEKDNMGCRKKCICNFCTPYELQNRNATNFLYIETGFERKRWVKLTLQVLQSLT